jgi:hypothetical protein
MVRGEDILSRRHRATGLVHADSLSK